ncbi:MAG: hypothetical protein HGA65_15860 [Oscillochloris sp.]|nr:hypothetical protein [Oscillochloris sp.]
MQWPESPHELSLASLEINAMLEHALTTIVLTRLAISTALPPELLADTVRSSNDLIYVLFEDIDDNTQRQYVITIQEETSFTWRMIVNATPALDGSMLLSIGKTRHFMARFNLAGEARFEGIPASVIFDPGGLDFEFAVLPPKV